jgi:hypothetical protein
MEHNPSKIIPPNAAEVTNAALAVAIEKVARIRWYAPSIRRFGPPPAPVVADAFEAIIDLVAPHWRMSQGDGQ